MRWRVACSWIGLAAAAFAACRAEDQRPPPWSMGHGGGATSGVGSGSEGGDGQGAGHADGGGGSGGGAEGGVSILSWNLETFPVTADTTTHVVELLAELDPDVVAVQEISDPATFLSLPDALP